VSVGPVVRPRGKKKVPAIQVVPANSGGFYKAQELLLMCRVSLLSIVELAWVERNNARGLVNLLHEHSTNTHPRGVSVQDLGCSVVWRYKNRCTAKSPL